MTEREWTETEMARLEALDDWLDGVRARRECLGAARGLFDERKRLKRTYAEDVSIYAPELGARFKAVRREIYEIAMELWRRGEAMDPRPLLEKAVSDDLSEKEDERYVRTRQGWEIYG